MNFKRQILLGLIVTALVAPVGVFARQQKPDNITKIETQKITVDELKSMLALKERVTIIDVRGHDYDSSDSRIKGAIRIDPADLESHLAGLPRDSKIVTYCSCPTDGGAVSAARVLELNGFKDVRALKGGWNSWVRAGGPTESK
ncbi:MAG TPA: rhodanese-like domain-containing protein [Blastocatellia bacterium]